MSLALNFRKRRRASTLPVPVSPRIRIASLAREKLEAFDVRPFAPETWPEMAETRPNVLLGSLNKFEMLIACLESGILQMSSVDTALLVATEFGSCALSDVNRVILWQEFGVPVYELIVSPQGPLIASECEAHEGWHLEPGVQLGRGRNVLTWPVPGKSQPLGMIGQIDDSVCACGRKSERIVSGPEASQGTCVLAAIA